jgi:Protein of unknown function (DUF2802)
MINLFQIAVITAGIAIALVLLALVRANLKLRQQYRVLMNNLSACHNDIAGLCSAALTVNNRITTTEEMLNELSATFAEYQQNKLVDRVQAESPDTAYSAVIQRVRDGANVNELMQNCGLSHDEAALLIRLHGSSEQLQR